MTNKEEYYAEALRFMNTGRLDEAALRLAALVASDTDARFHSAHGICLQRLGRWSEAIQQFEAALALKPAYCEADWRNMLAQSYFQAGQKPEAIAQWRIVARMAPSYPNRDHPIDEAKRMLETHGQ
jgi:tetratricopeptide (TPR) repeat protein